MKKLLISLVMLVNLFILYPIKTISAQESVDPALTEAARNGDLPKVETLLTEGADINQNDGAPLKVAISYNHFDVAKALIDKGADVNGALLYAISNSDIRFTKLLLQAGADTSLLKLGNKVAVKLGLWFNTGPRSIYTTLLMVLPIYFKFFCVFICFLILMWPISLVELLKIAFFSITSTILFAPITIILYIFAAFSGSHILALFCFLLLGILGFIIDMTLTYLLRKILQLKVESYPIWLLGANLLTVSIIYILLLILSD